MRKKEGKTGEKNIVTLAGRLGWLLKAFHFSFLSFSLCSFFFSFCFAILNQAGQQPAGALAAQTSHEANGGNP